MVELIKTYFMNGTAPKGTRHPFALTDPPTSGHGHVVVIRGEKRSTLLCPFSLRSYQMMNHFAEVAAGKVVQVEPLRLASLITKNWEDCVAMGLQRDYSVAALVLTELGAEVPKMAPVELAEGEVAKTQGGKPANPAILRVVKPSSKRGEVALFFHSATPQSVHEAMARLGLTRSGVLSHLFCLHRDHGVGYTLANDCATLLVPDGFDLFAYVEPERKAVVVPTDAEGIAGAIGPALRRSGLAAPANYGQQ